MVNMEQKDTMLINGIEFKMANKYATNYREKSPVIGVIQERNEYFNEGDTAIFHHNHFYGNSPYLVENNLFSVPMNKTILCLIKGGDIFPLFGNMICERIEIATPLPVSPEYKKFYHNVYKIKDKGWTTYHNDEIIFTRPHSGYEIVYIYNNIKKSAIKVDSEMVCGVWK